MTESATTKVETVEDAEKAARDKALKDAYVAATRRLRDAHQDEFNGYRQLEAAERGFEWKPRESAEVKAAAEMQRLLTEFPGLMSQINPAVHAAPVPQSETESGPTTI